MITEAQTKKKSEHKHMMKVIDSTGTGKWEAKFCRFCDLRKHRLSMCQNDLP